MISMLCNFARLGSSFAIPSNMTNTTLATTEDTLKWTKFDLSYIANTLQVLHVKPNAPIKDILAFLAADAEALRSQRDQALPNSLQRLDEVTREMLTTPENTARRSTAVNRVRWHELQIAKSKRQAKAYASLAAKLRNADSLPVDCSHPSRRAMATVAKLKS